MFRPVRPCAVPVNGQLLAVSEADRLPVSPFNTVRHRARLYPADTGRAAVGRLTVSSILRGGLPNQQTAQPLVQRYGGRPRCPHDLEHKPKSSTRPKLRRGADQSFAELSAASARPDEEPRDYRQLGRRAPRRRAQRYVLDAEHLHRGAANTGPHRASSARIGGSSPRLAVIRWCSVARPDWPSPTSSAICSASASDSRPIRE